MLLKGYALGVSLTVYTGIASVLVLRARFIAPAKYAGSAPAFGSRLDLILGTWKVLKFKPHE
jgi:hypothetical protein